MTEVMPDSRVYSMKYLQNHYFTLCPEIRVNLNWHMRLAKWDIQEKRLLTDNWALHEVN